MNEDKPPPRVLAPPANYEDRRNPPIDAREYHRVVLLEPGRCYDIRLLDFREPAESRQIYGIAFAPIRCSERDWETIQASGVLRIGNLIRPHAEVPVWWMIRRDLEPPITVYQGELVLAHFVLGEPLRETAIIGVGFQGVRRAFIPPGHGG